jgi:hypothetical protein
MEEIDGESTVSLVRTRLGVEITIQDAISLEHCLFEKLSKRAEAAEKDLKNMTALRNGSEKSVLAWKNEVELEQSKRIQSEKACAEMSYRMAEAYFEIEGLGDGAPDSAPWAQACNRAEGHLMHGEVGKQLGRSYISLTDPVIVGLAYCLNEFTEQRKAVGLTPPPRVSQALTAYEARMKELTNDN